MPEDLQDAFARIEREVAEGRPLGELGFWRLVREVKRDPRLCEHWADQVGRIDRMAFEAAVRPRVPVWLGNLILLVQLAAMVVLVIVAIALARDAAGSGEPWLPGLMIVVAGGGASVGVHDLAHWVVGRVAGIRFTSYFLKRPLLTPGLKIDYASYLRVSPGSRAWMHASGAIASKLAPFAVFAAAYLPHRAAGYDLFPSWSLWAVLGIGVVQIVTDIALSTKHSDWKKVKRERRVARAQRVDTLKRR